MKILTSAQMREVGGLTIEREIRGLFPMENPAYRVVEFLGGRYGPPARHRIARSRGRVSQRPGEFFRMREAASGEEELT